MLRIDDKTRFAIKAALSVALTIYLALSFGWEKPYWAGVVVVILVTTSSHGHARQKASHRLLGTLVGTISAVLLMNLAQEHALFFVCFLLLGAVASYLSVSSRQGYVYQVGFMVCAIVCFAGGLNEQQSFYLAILRIQENLLGVICFSLVFALLWPKSVATEFFEQFSSALELINQSQQHLTTGCSTQQHKQLAQAGKGLERCAQILDLPAGHLGELHAQRAAWQQCLDQGNALLSEMKLSAHRGADPACKNTLIALMRSVEQKEVTTTGGAGDRAINAENPPQVDQPDEQRMKARWHAIGFVLATLVTWGIWIYLPLPGGFMIPLLGGSLVISLVGYSSELIFKTGLLVLLISTAVLIEFVFLMPALNGGWELAGFYFINCFAIWRIFHQREYTAVRMLGGLWLLLLTMSAQHLRPQFDIQSPLQMLMYTTLILMIVRSVKQWIEQCRSVQNPCV